jgi:hypothetical protein
VLTYSPATTTARRAGFGKRVRPESNDRPVTTLIRMDSSLKKGAQRSDAIPCNRAAADDMSRSDLE